MLIRINVNLIGFSSNRSIGTLIFAKRLLGFLEKKKEKRIEFIYYAQKQLDLSGFNISDSSRIVRVPNMKSPIIRMIYEHSILRLKLKRADYIYTPYLTIPLFFSKEKQIITIHDMVPFKLQNKYARFKGFFIKLETVLAAKMAKGILTVSNNSKKDIIEILGVESNKVSVVYNFVDRDEAVIRCLERKDIIGNLGIKRPYFLTVSTLQPGKNIERLIRAFSLFVKNKKGYQLCIVGAKGWNFLGIYEEVRSLGVEDDVVFTGYVNDDVLDNLYQSCKGVVYVSLYEGFGIPPLEGLYHKKASIVSCNSSLPEVVGNTAILVNPMDEHAISRGLESFMEEERILVSRIPEQLQKFDPDKIAKSFIEVFCH